MNTHTLCDLFSLLRRQGARYPAMLPQDAVKLLYQREFGPGHAVPSAADAERRLRAELLTLSPDDHLPLYEELGGGLARLHLAALPSRCVGLRPATLAAFFVYTAHRVHGSLKSFVAALNTLRTVCAQGALPFSPAALDAYLTTYAAAGYPAVHHSEAYRARYAPAYRVVDERLCRYLPLFAAVDRLAQQLPTVCVAIDGPAASGKSSLGGLVHAICGGNLFHMDDYFLPRSRRSRSRLLLPGGNVDHERFQEEVLCHWRGPAPFFTRAYDCAKDALAPAVQVNPAPFNLVEGVYSLHPQLRAAYDLKIFLTIPPEEQLRRLRARNEALYPRFVGEWIPLENAYFTALRPREDSDLTF